MIGFKNIVLLLSAVFSTVLFAVEGLLVPTAAVNINDQIAGILPVRPVQIYSLRDAAPGQPFYLRTVIKSPKIVDGRINISGSLSCIDPNGKKTVIFEKVRLSNIAFNGKGVVFSGVNVKVVFKDSDPKGKYEYRLTMTDDNDGGKTTEIKPVSVVLSADRSDAAPMSVDECDKFVNNYYRKPEPRRLLAAFDCFLEKIEPAERKRLGKRYMPQHILHWFGEALRLNPQLWQDFVSRSSRASALQRQYIALILNDIGSEAVKKCMPLLDADMKKRIERFNSGNPLYVGEIKYPVHIDMLWAEFIVSGKIEPLAKIVTQLNKRDIITPEEMKKITDSGKKISADDRRKAVNFINSINSYRSLLETIRQGHVLVAYYLENMLNKKLLTDKAAEALVYDILRKAENKKTPEKKISK